jgi:hypothetical protein
VLSINHDVNANIYSVLCTKFSFSMICPESATLLTQNREESGFFFSRKEKIAVLHDCYSMLFYKKYAHILKIINLLCILFCGEILVLL